MLDEKGWASLGEGVEPGGRPPAPASLRVLQQFVNSWNHELPASWDRLRTVRSAVGWLAAHGLLSESSRLTERDRRRLIAFREGLQHLLQVRRGRKMEPEVVQVLNRLTVPLRVVFDAGGASHLRPDEDGARAVIGRLLSAAHEARVAGSWSRLKGCRQCGWAFYDRSKNRSGSWCAMSICGNRAKNRSYRRRREPTSSE